MDGITNRLQEALFHAPVNTSSTPRIRAPADRKLPLRLSRRSRAPNRLLIGATNVRWTPSIRRSSARPDGRHIWFRTPTKEDRVDLFDLYAKSNTSGSRTERRRDELARIAIGIRRR